MGSMLDKMKSLAATMGLARLAAMGVVALATLAALAWVATSRPAEPMGYLYTDLDPAAAKAITEKLAAQNIPYQLADNGGAIMAPQGRLAELRMAMAGEGLEGAIGYAVLDQEQGFGLSASRERLNETRALEGELAKSINTLSAVGGARVHIVMPERALFATEGRKASAAVTLKTTGDLSPENVKAIRNLVAAAVPELSSDQVSVVDQQGRLLARAGDGAGMDGDGGDSDARQAGIENRLRQEVETLLEPIVGPGKVRAQVSAQIERASRKEESRSFDPDQQVVARQITVESDEEDTEGQTATGTSVAAQLPLEDAESDSGDRRASRSNEASEDIRYDNGRIDRTTIEAPGAVKRLTVAVMIDAGARKMNPAEIQRLTRLVEGAVGFDSERGDSVVVEAMAFAPAPEAEGAMDGLWDSMVETVPASALFDMMKLLLILGAGFLLLRVLRQPRGEAAPPALLTGGEESAGGMAALPAGGAIPIGSDGGAMPALTDQRLEPAEIAAISQTGHAAQIDHEIALTQVEGGIKASSLRRIGQTISGHPSESASVIRQWMAG